MQTRRTIVAIAMMLGTGAVAGTQPASAQTPAPTAPQIVVPKKPTSATPQMIEEAIQRSQARAAKARDQGIPEKWGSEEPFTYIPGKTY